MIELPNGITLIAAIGKSGQLGLANKLPWPHDKEDMKWFQQVTIESDVCIVGYNTYLSLPTSVRVSLDRTIVIDRPEFVSPLDFLKMMAKVSPEISQHKIVVIGGAKTYERWMPLARTVLITKIDYNGPADTWMPELWERNAEGFTN